MKKYFELFLSFFKIGAFTLGGGYAMVSLIQKEVVENKKWVEKEEFVDMLALAQASPGPLAVNTAVFVGYKTAGVPGSIATTLGTIAPSFMIIITIAVFFIGIQNEPAVISIFKGLRPAVVALIAAPIYSMAKNAKVNRKTIIIPIIATVLVAFLDVSPIYIILAAAIGGIIYINKWGGKDR
ncbi:chromate transporter [Clostridium thermarum]|uniref:chromate transporter n=1 Tax=Clostridium thermarum TaxID=1716543 RepID=UPI0013D47B44|nr:chromate transporter [Clostridium thermarum]